MICYLVRHGKDDETVRGGWSQSSLQEEGIRQAESLGCSFAAKQNIGKLYSSDLTRAMQTAQIIGKAMDLSVIPLACFREVNNGELAGMKNTLALTKYPGLFWNTLGWEQSYPGGESPKAFYERIKASWHKFSGDILSREEDVILVTHGGVIQVILSLTAGEQYTNVCQRKKIPYASCIPLVYRNGNWKELTEEKKEEL